MDAIALRSDILSYCQAYADETIVKKYARYFKNGTEGYDAYGLTTELILAKVRNLNENNQVTKDLLLETAPSLLRSGKQEETYIVLLLTEKQLKKLTEKDFTEIGRWFEYGIVNWAQCDTLCNKIIPWFFLHNLLPVNKLKEWVTSPFRFQRRAVPVQMVKLLKSTNDYAQFFDLIAPLMMDPERVVHQGLGWFLREAWKKQPGQTEEFLLKWKDKSARLIFQYATEKMDKEQKLRFRREKN